MNALLATTLALAPFASYLHVGRVSMVAQPGDRFKVTADNRTHPAVPE